jgi:hypothetical protein
MLAITGILMWLRGRGARRRIERMRGQGAVQVRPAE